MGELLKLLAFPYAIRETPSMTCHIIASPVGALALTAEDEALISIDLLGTAQPSKTDDHPLLDETARQLTAYFAGTLKTFDIPLKPAPTSRGNDLRAGIAAIPYGKVASYGEVAGRISSAPRAIGRACSQNPFPIIIPCHRVIAAKGAIGYYSAGDGIATKIHLLGLENPDLAARWNA